MLEKDLDKVNEIDMECHVMDDDDFIVNDETSAADDREVQSKTGIIINFDDDDDIPVRKIIADTSTTHSGINVTSDFSEEDFHDYNAIDMETKYGDDEDEIYDSKSNPLFIDKEPAGLVAEEMLEEGKRSISFGQVEDDYWDKISSKHKKTNKKGAYNAHFHFAGNPKKEAEMFNQMMGSDSLATTSATNVASGSDSSSATSPGGEGCCEDLSTSDYSKKLSELLDIIGFEVFKNSDGSYVAIDRCDVLPEITAATIADLIQTLQPYLEDCLIYPLQLITNNNFKTYNEWVEWYTDDMRKAYPKCASDIAYCDLLANHLPKCEIN